MKISYVIDILFTKILTWYFNLARDVIERMTNSQWFLRVPACLRSCDWEFRMEAILIQTCLFVGIESAML